MSWHRPVFSLGRTFTNGDGFFDLSALLAGGGSVAPLAHHPPASKMGEEFLFQSTPGLHEQSTVDGLVRHAHRLVVRIPSFQPTRDLLGRPVLLEFPCHHIAQEIVYGEQASLGTQSSLPRLLVRLLSPVILTPAITVYFPAYGGGTAAQPRSDCTNGFSGSKPAGDLLPLSWGECTSSPVPLGWREAAGGLKHPMNGARRLL